jgi:hypothetical protein
MKCGSLIFGLLAVAFVAAAFYEERTEPAAELMKAAGESFPERVYRVLRKTDCVADSRQRNLVYRKYIFGLVEADARTAGVTDPAEQIAWYRREFDSYYPHYFSIKTDLYRSYMMEAEREMTWRRGSLADPGDQFWVSYCLGLPITDVRTHSDILQRSAPAGD